MLDEKPFRKEGQKQGAKKDPGSGNEVRLVWSHLSNGYTLCMFCNTLLIKTSTIFS